MGYADKALEYTFWALGSFQNFLFGKIFQVKVKSLSRVQLFVTLWAVALKATPSKGFFQARILEKVALSFSRGTS